MNFIREVHCNHLIPNVYEVPEDMNAGNEKQDKKRADEKLQTIICPKEKNFVTLLWNKQIQTRKE